MRRPQYFCVFWKIATQTVCRISHRENDAEIAAMKIPADERMIKVSYANAVNLSTILASMGIQGR